MSALKQSPKAAQAAEGEVKNRPVHEVRMGRICGAIWRQQTDDGKVWYNVTLSRIYKDGQGNWARSDSFGRSDLPLVIKVADACHTWMYETAKEAVQESTQSEEIPF